MLLHLILSQIFLLSYRMDKAPQLETRKLGEVVPALSVDEKIVLIVGVGDTNTPLIEKVGKAIGNEVLESNVDIMLEPGLNIPRHPMCGRIFEYFSEDPQLSGKMAAAYVRGVQWQGVGTSIRHFAANNQESDRRNYDATISQRALQDKSLDGADFDRSVAYVLKFKTKTPLSKGYKPSFKFNKVSHDSLSGASAGETIVLLKNSNAILDGRTINKKSIPTRCTNCEII